KEDKKLFRLANKLHYKTRSDVIRRQLLFHPGDTFSQRALDESERILRSQRYLYDAVVRPVDYHDGVVDIAVTTRDVWTLNPGVSFGRKGGKNSGGFELEELNILGTGTSVSLSHKSEVDRNSNLFEYKNKHVGGSWTSLALSYADNSDGSTRALDVERPFYSLTTPWAFGVAGFDDDRVDSLYDLGEAVDKFRHKERNATVYGGWSNGLVNGWTRRWLVGATYDENVFDAAADWNSAAVIPNDRKFVYPWIGLEIIQDDYIKERNRDQIGRTEDFHLGTQIRARLGWAGSAFGSSDNAWILKLDASQGYPLSNASTLLLSAGSAARVEGSQLQNALIEGAVRYYMQQSKKALFFATISGAAGKRLDIDNQILLGGDNGLRGYPLRYQTGSSRALLTVEQRYFTNWYPWRLFRVGAAAFFDVGRTWGSTAIGNDNQGLLKDVGVGLRFGATRSGLGNVIHVDVAFPLDGDSSIKNVQFLVETKTSF
ncbi:MAG TPA: BamA/TamA family outer membrane protein, partial [Steroidobacteraceae bacterium]|nr:BamA/TamA family outer membrane protein [Steroidobacteraceae bacterium]